MHRARQQGGLVLVPEYDALYAKARGILAFEYRAASYSRAAARRRRCLVVFAHDAPHSSARRPRPHPRSRRVARYAKARHPWLRTRVRQIVRGVLKQSGLEQERLPRRLESPRVRILWGRSLRVMTIRAMMPRARTSRSRTPRALSDARGSSETRGPDRESRTSGLAGAPARRRTSGSRPASRTTRPGVPRNGRRWLRDSSTETHRLKGRTARGAARRRAIRFRLDNAEGAEVLGRSASPLGASAWRASSSLWQWCPQLIAAAATALELRALRGLIRAEHNPTISVGLQK